MRQHRYQQLCGTYINECCRNCMYTYPILPSNSEGSTTVGLRLRPAVNPNTSWFYCNGPPWRPLILPAFGDWVVRRGYVEQRHGSRDRLRWGYREGESIWISTLRLISRSLDQRMIRAIYNPSSVRLNYRWADLKSILFCTTTVQKLTTLFSSDSENPRNWKKYSTPRGPPWLLVENFDFNIFHEII